MKKVLNWKMLMLVIASMSFFACKPTVDNPPVVVDEWTKADVTRFVYLGQQEDGNHLFLLYMSLEGAIVDNKIVKNTTEWYLPFLSESVSADLKPKFGEYPISFEADYQKNTVNGNFAYAQNLVVEGTHGEEIKYTEGKLVIEANKITFQGKTTDNKEYKIMYEGNYTVINQAHNAWFGEPETTTTKNEEFTQGTLKVVKETTDTILLMELNKVNGNDRVDAQIEVYINGNDSVLKAGNYQIAGDKNIYTFRASEGLSEFMEIIGCALYYTNTAGGNTSAHEIYYITAGNVVVTANDMTISATSHFGSIINIKYTGSLKFTPARS